VDDNFFFSRRGLEFVKNKTTYFTKLTLQVR